MNNQFTGNIDLKLMDQSLTLCYDWDAVMMLVSELGEDFDSQITDAGLTPNLEVLAKVLSIGLELHHPGKFPPGLIMKMSPPIIPVAQGIQQAMTVAWYGTTMGDPSLDPKRPVRRFLKRILWDWWNQPS